MRRFITRRTIGLFFVLTLVMGCFVACQGDVQTDMPSTTISPEATTTPDTTINQELTMTPEPTEEEMPTDVPEPTATSVLTVTPEPTATLEPTVTPEPEIKENVTLDSIKEIDESYIGNYVNFGRYEQDNIIENGQEDIEWLILDVKDGKALLLSRYLLDGMVYHNRHIDITWENCFLRKWLNHEFYFIAFQKGEQSAIVETMLENPDNSLHGTLGGNDTVDKIFILSADEAISYFDSGEDVCDIARRAYATEYAKTKGWIYYESIYGFLGTTEYDGIGIWILRTPGEWGLNIRHVDLTGRVVNDGTSATDDPANLIRPALWVNIN